MTLAVCVGANSTVAVTAFAQDTFGARDRASTEAVESLNAYAAYKMGDYESARQQWESLAQRDNTSAIINLANLYEQGQGVPRDPAKAAEWLRRAAELGDPRGQTQLGMAYEKGLGVPRDLQKAESWFRRAAEQGDTTAQFNLGVMLATAQGKGVSSATKAQRREAADWLEKAAAGGHPDAHEFLATLRESE